MPPPGPRRLLVLALLLPAFLVGGCALRPDHLTFYVEANDAQTTAGGRRTGATGHREAVSITYDLDKR